MVMKITSEILEKIETALRRRPADVGLSAPWWTVAALTEWLCSIGVSVSTRTIERLAARRGWTFRPARTGPPSRAALADGARRRRASIARSGRAGRYSRRGAEGAVEG